jgi:hypothetical protein
MDVIKQIQQRERRAKAKAERAAKFENTPEYKEEKKKLDKKSKSLMLKKNNPAPVSYAAGSAGSDGLGVSPGSAPGTGSRRLSGHGIEKHNIASAGSESPLSGHAEGRSPPSPLGPPTAASSANPLQGAASDEWPAKSGDSMGPEDQMSPNEPSFGENGQTDSSNAVLDSSSTFLVANDPTDPADVGAAQRSEKKKKRKKK